MPPGETEAAPAEPAWHAGIRGPGLPSPERLPAGSLPCIPHARLCDPGPCSPGTPGSGPSPHMAADVAAPSASPSLRTRDRTLLVTLTSPWRASCRFFPNLCRRQRKGGVSCRGCPGWVGTLAQQREVERLLPVETRLVGRGGDGVWGFLSRLQLLASGFADSACSLREACPAMCGPNTVASSTCLPHLQAQARAEGSDHGVDGG